MQNTMLMVADLMKLSALTAPKALGQDFVKTKIVSGAGLEELAAAMERYGRETGKANFDRDAANVRQSDALLLLALVDAKPAGLDCGACGCDRCADLQQKEGPEFLGPLCAWRVMDLGIALGSAVKTAGILNADNRIMYRPGVAAKKTGLMEGDIIVGIPLSATSKNIYFDRAVKKLK